MDNLKERILNCKTANELNSLKLLTVKDKQNFKENQMAFIKMKNKFQRMPLRERPKDFGAIYNPEIEQQIEKDNEIKAEDYKDWLIQENAKLKQDVDGLEGNCRWLKNKNKKLEAELSQCKQTIADLKEAIQEHLNRIKEEVNEQD